MFSSYIHPLQVTQLTIYCFYIHITLSLIFIQISRDRQRGGGYPKWSHLITGGRGGVWSRPKYDHEILEQPLKCSSFINIQMLCLCKFFIQRWWWSFNWNVKNPFQLDSLANMLILIIHNIPKLLAWNGIRGDYVAHNLQAYIL